MYPWAESAAATAAGVEKDGGTSVAGIFLSYRREDTAGYSGRLADALRDNFGEAVIFRDVDTITPGVDFIQAITKAVEEADVLLAVIGPRWLTAKDKDRRRRIDDPEDYVRLEITTALERGGKVLPVLVDGARLPRAQNVPEPLRPLLRRQAIELTDSRWSYDLGVLLDELRPTLRSTERKPEPAEEKPGLAPPRSRRWLRVEVLGFLSALLVGLVGFVQTQDDADVDASRASRSSPTTTVLAPSPPPSSVPEPTTTVSVGTTVVRGGVVPPQPGSPPDNSPGSPTPTNPPPTAPPPTAPPPPPPPYYPYEKASGDGAVGAHKTPDGNHFIVRRVSTGDVIFTSHPQYVGDPGDASNDVKAGKFCSGSRTFAATYHYWGGTSIYSWIGYWSTATGQLVSQDRAEGEVYSLDSNC